MSERITDYYDRDFELNERVSFLHKGERLYGEVARVYNSRELYHVEVAGLRYSVHGLADDMRRE